VICGIILIKITILTKGFCMSLTQAIIRLLLKIGARIAILYMIAWGAFELGTYAYWYYVGTDAKILTKSNPMLMALAKQYKAFDQGHVSEERFNSLTIGFYKNTGEKSNTLAFCNMFSNEVLIDIDHWNRMDDLTRVAVVFHELGHCLSGRIHTGYSGHLTDDIPIFLGLINNTDYFLDNCPKSLMYPTILPRTCLKRYWNYYMIDLFQ
jgi:hypothetical protein